MIVPWVSQIQKAKEGYDILKTEMIVYLAMEERTGKTLTAILIADMCQSVEKILVVTKKGKALEGWQEVIPNCGSSKEFTLINYHMAPNIKDSDWDLIILDEAHNYISSFPKIPGGLLRTKKRLKRQPRMGVWEALSYICKKKPIIYISATPHPQGKQMLFHQFALSSWSPWRSYTNFYNWFNDYGIPETIYVGGGRKATSYEKVRDNLIDKVVDHLFVTGTRKELGFAHEPHDKLHFFRLNESTQETYNTLLSDGYAVHEGIELVCDSSMKLRTTLHQLEGGCAKVTEITKSKHTKEPILKSRPVVFSHKEKIDYILKHWGDIKSLVIFYHYIAEGIKLNEVFKKASILQAVTNAEGVDLSMYDTVVIYSQNFSTAKHTQRRARQANKYRNTPITVHYLLVENAISHQVYETVSVNKKDFVDSVFERKRI